MGFLPYAGGEPVIVVGGGIAGLATALNLAPVPVILVVGARVGEEAATALAQGGIAAALGRDDRPALHAADTLRTGAGLGDAGVIERVTAAAPTCIAAMVANGVPFDRDAAGEIALGLEAAHSRRRIVHADGDGTGRAVIEALGRKARLMPSVTILEDARVTDLLVEGGTVCGIRGTHKGRTLVLTARCVVLATGGVGGLYASTTNPLGAVGSGLALAVRAGAVVRDMEFVQFHPTAIDVGLDPMPLASEALRGEGAILVNGRGERFMAGIAGEELAPRDVVARAIWQELQTGKAVYLDARRSIGRQFPERFPTVTALCRKAGLDPVTRPIPVRPAAHYHMGGVLVDAHGRSSVTNLYACGEVAATGLHGANRLASNSLLEALAYAGWIAEDIKGGALPRTPAPRPERSDPTPLAGATACATGLRELMSAAFGVIRDGAVMEASIPRLREAAFDRSRASADGALVALLMATAAHQRRESRGAHYRRDHPGVDPRWSHSLELRLGDVRAPVSRPTVEIGVA
jgi:L-aspartate oxidase